MQTDELRLLRNEFFARKGYIFNLEDLNDYFLRKQWYNPQFSTIDSIQLTPWEKQMIDSIKYYENKNKTLSDLFFKQELKRMLKDSKSRYGSDLYVPIALFRRNIGYLTDIDVDDDASVWGGNISINIIDTIKISNELVLGCFRQIMCPAEYCEYWGQLIYCDTDFNYIDSRHIFYYDGFNTKYKDNIPIYIFPVDRESESLDSITVEPHKGFREF
jgi:hypothetical protein